MASIEPFGHMPNGTAVHRVMLESDLLRVRIITFGAAIAGIDAPDRGGQRANVVLGLRTLDEYIARSPHFGAVPGRYAGRIAGGTFMLDGRQYTLACNNGPNAIHGGPTGFGKRNWTIAAHAHDHAILELSSPDGDEGYPGALHVTARYTLDRADLRLDLSAVSTRPTPINLTNHAYFNLAGEGAGSALGHRLHLPADTYLPTDPTGIPTGEIRQVEGTPFDFRRPRTIDQRIHLADPQLLAGRGYDHSFPVPGQGLRLAGILDDPGSGRTLAVHTTQPVIHLYTGNMLDGSLAGPSGRSYRQSDAICLEAQHAQDSPNHPNFPSTILRPGAPWSETIVFAFGVRPP